MTRRAPVHFPVPVRSCEAVRRSAAELGEEGSHAAGGAGRMDPVIMDPELASWPLG